MLQNQFYRVKIDCGKFLSCLVVFLQNQLLFLKLILREVKIFYFMSESLLEKLSNIDYFISKSILIKPILTKSIIFRINSIKAESNMHSDLLPHCITENEPSFNSRFISFFFFVCVGGGGLRVEN